MRNGNSTYNKRCSLKQKCLYQIVELGNERGNRLKNKKMRMIGDAEAIAKRRISSSSRRLERNKIEEKKIVFYCVQECHTSMIRLLF